MGADFWTNLANISTVVEAIVVTIALGFALSQIKQARQILTLDAFLHISQELNKPEARENRRFIYTTLPKPSPEIRSKLSEKTEVKIEDFDDDHKNFFTNLSKQDKAKIEATCVLFDQMGVLVEHNLIDKDVAASMYFDVVIKTWNKVLLFILLERKKRESKGYPEGLHMKYFGLLVEHCKDYCRKQNNGVCPDFDTFDDTSDGRDEQ